MGKGRAGMLALVACFLLLSTRGVRAEGQDERLEQAKTLFRQGLASLHDGDLQNALESFQRSRDIVPSVQNTVNAAICLERLARYDEALEMYEEVLARFAGDLAADDRSSLGPLMAELQTHVGYVDLSSNVEGELAVDGRPRGHLPLRGPLRVVSGKRSIRVSKNGYRPFDASLDVGAGETLPLYARLVEVPVETAAAAADSTSGRPAIDAALVPTSPEPTREPGPWARPTIIGGSAFTAAGVATAVITTLSLSHERDQLAQNCAVLDGDDCAGAAGDKRAAAQKSVDRIATLKNVRWVAYGATALGVAAVAVGIVELVTHRKSGAVSRNLEFEVSRRSWRAGWQFAF